MAEVLAEGEPTVPPQRRSGTKCKYVYWVAFWHPEPETVERLGLKVLVDFTRKTFSQLVVKAHGDCNVQIEATVSLQEPHANRLIHHKCLVQASSPFCAWRFCSCCFSSETMGHGSFAWLCTQTWEQRCRSCHLSIQLRPWASDSLRFPLLWAQKPRSCWIPKQQLRPWARIRCVFHYFGARSCVVVTF